MSTQSLSHDTTDAPLENTITDLIGLKVYTTDGLYIGTVADVRINFDQQQANGLALRDINMNAFSGYVDAGSGIVIPYRWVRAANDVILVMDIVDRLEPLADE